METFVAFLRGINVSGQKMVRMDDLAKALGKAGLSNIRTYIQSGNILFQYNTVDHSEIASKIAGTIAENFAMNVPVVIRTSEDLRQTCNNNPFLTGRNEDVSKLHVTFLADEPDQDKIKRIEKETYLPDEFHISGKEVYLFCPNGYGRTKLNNTFFENKLKTQATTRNWKTILALLSL